MVNLGAQRTKRQALRPLSPFSQTPLISLPQLVLVILSVAVIYEYLFISY